MIEIGYILKGNKIIAEFMGYKVFEKRYPRNHGIGGSTYDWSKDCILEKLKYHKSWDSLIPVVKKCHTAEPPTFIAGLNKRGWSKSDRIESCIPYMAFENNDIEAIWKAVVEFIKWYNKEINE